MDFQAYLAYFQGNKLLSLVLIVAVLIFIVSFIVPIEDKTTRFLDQNEVHFETWDEIMAKKEAVKVTTNTIHACDLLFEMNETSWTYGGWRCVKNTIYFDETCGENNDEFCDCICYY